MDITARISDDNTRGLVRACELARLQLIEAHTADRFQIASRLPGYVDNDVLRAWRQHFEAGGPKGSENWRRSTISISPPYEHLMAKRVADCCREWDDYLNDLEPRDEDLPVSEGGTRPNDPRDKRYEIDPTNSPRRHRKRGQVMARPARGGGSTSPSRPSRPQTKHTHFFARQHMRESQRLPI